MNILVAFECSGKVRQAFRDLGHDAWSCDLLPADDGSEYHYQMDALHIIKCQKWDMIIMHPPCTALALSGNRWYGRGMPRHSERLEAIEWTQLLWYFAKQQSPKVCLENPTSVIWKHIGKPQYIQPWMFGHGETKKTGLLLHNLPDLVPTNIVEGRADRIHKMPPGPDRAKLRSETYQGVADAIANQWSRLL